MSSRLTILFVKDIHFIFNSKQMYVIKPMLSIHDLYIGLGGKHNMRISGVSEMLPAT